MKMIKTAIVDRLLMIAFIVLCVVGALFSFARMVVFLVTGNLRASINIAIGFDQTVNAALNGAPDETISSRAGRKWPRSARFINWVFRDPNHCDDAIRAEVEGWQRAKS